MSVADQNQKSNWIDAWLEMQQGWLGHWQATAMEQRVDAMRVGMDTWRQQFNPANPSAEVLKMVQSFQTLLQSCMNQAGQQASAQNNHSFEQIMQAFPLGYAREQQLIWQTYLKAQGEYQQCATKLMQQFAVVFSQSLQSVPQVIEQRAQEGKTIQSMRELHELWIECGEQCFATIARSKEFVDVQAAHTNALSRLRIAEHALLDRWLQQHDLPTRSELNSLHQKVRSMSERIVELETQLAQHAPTTRGKKKT